MTDTPADRAKAVLDEAYLSWLACDKNFKRYNPLSIYQLGAFHAAGLRVVSVAETDMRAFSVPADRAKAVLTEWFSYDFGIRRTPDVKVDDLLAALAAAGLRMVSAESGAGPDGLAVRKPTICNQAVVNETRLSPEHMVSASAVPEAIKADLIQHLAASPRTTRRSRERGRRTTMADHTLAVVTEIHMERQRQIDKEGWSSPHDDGHNKGEMARAAAAYALHSAGFRGASEKEYQIKAHHPEWPWARQWWKPKDRRRDLVRAAALIVAEIERLDRKHARQQASGGEGE